MIDVEITSERDAAWAADRETKAPITLAQATEIIRGLTSNMWGLAMCGGDAQRKVRAYNRMRAPQIGDLVAEMTTVYTTGDPEIAVGYLERVVQEPVWTPAEMAACGAGEESPTETVHYIRTLTGRSIRWTNCKFVTALTDVRAL